MSALPVSTFGQLLFTEEEEQFRETLRKWLAENPPPVIDQVDSAAARSLMAWEGEMTRAGFGGLHWPSTYGGSDRPVGYQLVHIEELARERVPWQVTMVGWYMVGPLLIALGTDEQRSRFLPRILRGEELWTQLFSEPDAGSDLAGLKTTAVADGDQFVVNGQKVWSSWAHLADKGVLLARTDSDVAKHRGLSMFLIDMDAPGITVRPLRQMTGGAEFNEVFFEDVRVPADRMVGELHRGWQAALVVLGAERTGLSLGSYAAFGNELSGLLDDLGSCDEPVLRQGIAHLYTMAVIQRLTSLRTASGLQTRPEQILGAASVGKLQMTSNMKALANLRVSVFGPAGTAWPTTDERSERVVRAVLGSAAAGIGGGTTEVQKNAIAERILGLPKEPPIERASN